MSFSSPCQIFRVRHKVQRVSDSLAGLLRDVLVGQFLQELAKVVSRLVLGGGMYVLYRLYRLMSWLNLFL